MASSKERSETSGLTAQVVSRVCRKFTLLSRASVADPCRSMSQLVVTARHSSIRRDPRLCHITCFSRIAANSGVSAIAPEGSRASPP